MNKNNALIILSVLSVTLFALALFQDHLIREYRQNEQEWVELSKLWREKMDTCMNRNERIYNELYRLQEYKIKMLQEERGDAR